MRFNKYPPEAPIEVLWRREMYRTKSVRVEESRTIKLSSAGVSQNASNLIGQMHQPYKTSIIHASHASQVNFVLRDDLVLQIVFFPDCKLFFLGNVLTAALLALYSNVFNMAWPYP